MVDKSGLDSSFDFELEEEEAEEPFDQFADEMQFYSQRRHPILDDDDVATTDSGYNSPRCVVEERDNNQSRKSTTVVNCNRFDLKLARLKDLRLLEQRVRKSSGQQAIAWHLLDFITPKSGSDCKLPRNQGMFQVVNDRVHVHNVYDRARTGHQQGVSEMFVNVANSLLDTHNQLIDLEEFAEQQRRITNPPPFITGWLEFYDIFINDYSRDISRLKTACIHPLTALGRSSFLREQVALLHSIINPVKAALMWKYEETDLSWSLLLTATADCSHLTGAQISVALGLQKTFYSILLNTMDHLYYNGQLPSSSRDHFVIQGDKSRSDVFEARKISRGSVLWNKNLANTVIGGVVLRRRLPAYFLSPTCFSNTFSGLAENWSERVIPLTEMRFAFQETCNRLTNELSEEMFRRVVEAGVRQLWRDIKSIALGVAANLFVSSVFNLENMQHSESDAFCNAIRVGGVSSVAHWSRTSVPGFTGSLNCEVSGVLSHLVNKSLLSAINQGLDSWMKLYRMHFLLVAILSSNDCLERSSRSVKRQFRFTVTKLFSVVETIRSHFYRMFSEVFDSAAELMKQAKSFYDLERILLDAESGILTLVNNSTDPTARALWAAVDRFSVLVDDIRLRSLSMAVTRESIDEWRCSFLCSCEALSSLGRTATADNVFFSLCSKIQYR